MTTYTSSGPSVLTWIVFLVPTACVCIAGVAAAFAFMRRYPRPAVLTLLAIALLAVTSFAQPVLQFWLLPNLGHTAATFMEMMTFITSVISVLRMIMFGLLLTAVFIDRRPLTPSENPAMPAARVP